MARSAARKTTVLPPRGRKPASRTLPRPPSPMASVVAEFSELRGELAHRLETESWPLQVPLTSGRICEVKPAIDSTVPHTHFVLVFPEHQGPATEHESLEMFSLTMLFSRELARLLLGNPECYTISKNGTHTGSVPDIEHYHLYMFRDRTDKIETYARNVIPAYQKLLQERAAAEASIDPPPTGRSIS